jgi:hypothetical protein
MINLSVEITCGEQELLFGRVAVSRSPLTLSSPTPHIPCYVAGMRSMMDDVGYQVLWAVQGSLIYLQLHVVHISLAVPRKVLCPYLAARTLDQVLAYTWESAAPHTMWPTPKSRFS